MAVDEKTLRGSGDQQHPPVHLPATMRHTTTAILGQVAVAGKSNEITAFKPLLVRLDLTRTVVAADALHTQRHHRHQQRPQKSGRAARNPMDPEFARPPRWFGITGLVGVCRSGS